MIPPGMTYRDALIRGYTRPYRNRAYLDWVKSLICPCGAPADDPSHVNAYKGMGTKAHDLFTWPSCRACHELYERDRQAWRERYGNEWEWVAMTHAQAVAEGVMTL